jgi:hypothetical protein
VWRLSHTRTKLKPLSIALHCIAIHSTIQPFNHTSIQANQENQAKQSKQGKARQGAGCSGRFGCCCGGGGDGGVVVLCSHTTNYLVPSPLPTPKRIG